MSIKLGLIKFWLKRKAKEPSTYLGIASYIIAIMTNNGIVVPPEFQDTVANAMFFIASSALILVDEKDRSRNVDKG